MSVSITTESLSYFVPQPRPEPFDTIPIMLTVQLLGLVAGMAMVIGLIPAAIALVRMMF